MPVYPTEPPRLQLKLSKSEIQNIQEYAESGKTLLIKINDAMHIDACTGYYIITRTNTISEEDIIISLEAVKLPYPIVYISTLSTLINSEEGGEK